MTQKDNELIVLSAEHPGLLAGRARALARWIRENDGTPLVTISRTSTGIARRNTQEKCRLALLAQQHVDLITKLESAARTLERSQKPEGKGCFHGNRQRPPKLVAVFVGQGAQRPGLLADLRRDNQAFRECFDAVVDETPGGADILGALYPSPDARDSAERLRQTEICQPALAIVQLALLGLARRFGVHFDAFLGHSMGEFLALVGAGALARRDALTFFVERGRLVASAGGSDGAMAAVMAEAALVDAIAREISEQLVVANKNSPRQTIIAGPASEVDRAVEAFLGRSIAAKTLPVSHAFHSPMLAHIEEELAAKVADLELDFRRAQAVVSSVTAQPYPADLLAVREILCRHLTATVRFSDAVETAKRSGVDGFVEVAPGGILVRLIKDTLGRSVEAHSLAGRRGTLDDLRSTLGRLFALGVDPAFDDLYSKDTPTSASLVERLG